MLVRWFGDDAVVDAEALALLLSCTVRHARRQPAIACDLATRVLLYRA